LIKEESSKIKQLKISLKDSNDNTLMKNFLQLLRRFLMIVI